MKFSEVGEKLTIEIYSGYIVTSEKLAPPDSQNVSHQKSFLMVGIR